LVSEGNLPTLISAISEIVADSSNQRGRVQDME